MAADSLHGDVHVIVLSGVSLRLLLPCRRARCANASASHVSQHPAQPPNVQMSCLERAWPADLAAFVGVLAAHAAASPGRRCRERQRQAKAEGKIKGRGTTLCEKPVCTWGWRGTRLIAAPCRVVSQSLVGIALSACFSRLATLLLDGGAT